MCQLVLDCEFLNLVLAVILAVYVSEEKKKMPPGFCLSGLSCPMIGTTLTSKALGIT